MVSGLKGNTYEEKVLGWGLETLKSRRERQNMALMHKYVMSDRQNLFTLASNNGGARTMIQLICQRHLYLGSSITIIFHV
jgi:hypothetical protein